MENIEDLIPHRPPFLWVNAITAYEKGSISTTATFPKDLTLFKGHYPDYPLVPGVILCEAVFQSGAAMVAKQMRSLGNGDETMSGVPVLTRILGAKFKKEVRPGDEVTIDVTHTETLSAAWYMKGKVKVGGKLAVSVEFAVMISQESK